MKAKKGTTICSLNDLTFPVELRNNPRKTNREYSKVVVGMVNNEEMDLNYCSPIYELVPNATIFPKVEEILNQQGIAFTAQYSHTKHCRFYGNYIIEDPRFGYKMKGTNDVIKFIWNFQHSYNGLTKYKGVCGFYRLVCTNGLSVPVEEMKEYNLVLEGKHTASIIHSLEQFSNMLIKVTSELNVVKKAIVEKYEILGGRMVTNVEDRVKEVLNVMNIVNNVKVKDTAKMNNKELALYGKLIQTHREKVDVVLNTIRKEAYDTKLGYKGKVNDWLIYNAINGYIHNDEINIAAPEKRRETDSKVLEYMLEYA